MTGEGRKVGQLSPEGQADPGWAQPGSTVRVLPDVVAIDKEFDYLVPPTFERLVRVGSVVRVVLAGRRVGGWVTALDVEPPEGRVLRSLAHVTGWGPPPELMELSAWAAWRWAGQRAHFLRIASPPGAVRGLPQPAALRTASPGLLSTDASSGGPPPPPSSPPRSPPGPPPGSPPGPVLGSPPGSHPPDGAVVSHQELTVLLTEALGGGTRLLRLPPAADPTPVVVAAARLGPTLALVPAISRGAVLAGRLRRAGLQVALLPEDWARARAGVDVVVGARAAAWAPCPSLAAVVVVDAHDEAYGQQGAPTWAAPEVAAERARRAAACCVLISATPPLELVAGDGGGPAPIVVRPSRGTERRGWAPLEVVDRRLDDPRLGLWSTPLVRAIAAGGRVACVLNRRGRARILACASCGELVRCERCGAAAVEGELDRVPDAKPRRTVAELLCPQCGCSRPGVCLACGSTALKRLRVGVTRAAEELQALVGRPVTEVSGGLTRRDGPPDPIQGDLVIGTEAVLHRSGPLDVVAFVDFDQELLSPRYRAGEEALALLGRAARLVGGRRRGGKLLVQSRLPHHPAIEAALHADYDQWSLPELEVRQQLRLPPFASLATLSGEGAAGYVDGLAALAGERGGLPIEILGPSDDGRWLVKAESAGALADLLAGVARPGQPLRVEVGPRRA